MCAFCWPQSLSFRLMSSAAVLGLEILKYSGKMLNPARRDEECPKGTHCGRGSVIYLGSMFFSRKHASPVIQIYPLGEPISGVGL